MPNAYRFTSEQVRTQFNQSVLRLLNNYFQETGSVVVNTLQEAFIKYKTLLMEGKIINLDYKMVSTECDVPEHEVILMFQILQEKELKKWPQETQEAVQKRITELWQQLEATDDKKFKIKDIIDQEFQIRQRVEFSQKQIMNVINQQLDKVSRGKK
ncbi:Hypothetical_protein [Hexamita inflata]|uniref:Hypothetical_protein n=1 Tax=Hexamita inflata TaxID=28002 RepID=A0ABP1JHI5_9EUKA